MSCEVEKRLQKIIQQGKYCTNEACNICVNNTKSRECEKCHVEKLIKMLQEVPR